MKEDAVTCLNTFFQAIRQQGWDPTLPTTAVFFTGDTPGGRRGCPGGCPNT